MRYLRFSLILLSLIIPCSVAKAECVWSQPDQACVETIKRPGDNVGLNQKKDLLNIKAPDKPAPLADALYIVSLECKRVEYDPVNNAWGLFVDKKRTTSHIIAITNTRLGSGSLPSDARATVTVYSVSDGAQTKNDFINTGCNVSFVISGRDQIYLAATANQSDSNTPTALTNALYDVASIALSIGPLFTGARFVKDWQTPLKDIQPTQTPMNDLFKQMDNGLTVTKPADLYEGKTVVTTPYSRVEINITRIKSLVELGNKRYINDFEKVVAAAKSDLKLDTLTGATLSTKCIQFETNLLDRNFATTDVAYATAYIGMLSGLNATKENMLTCLGNKYALPALAQTRLWSRFDGAPFNQQDAKTFFANGVVAWPPQPSFQKVADNPLERGIAALGAYLQTPANKPDPDIAARLAKYFASSLVIENLSSLFPFEDKTIAQAEAFGTIAKKAQRAGCMTSDTEGVAVFFVFSTPDGSGKFPVSSATAIRVWLDEDGKVARFKVTKDAGLLEKALQARQSRICEDLEVLKGP